jgi:hypothetical protein
MQAFAKESRYLVMGGHRMGALGMSRGAEVFSPVPEAAVSTCERLRAPWNLLDGFVSAR